jgi:hypothetical protein
MSVVTSLISLAMFSLCAVASTQEPVHPVFDLKSWKDKANPVEQLSDFELQRARRKLSEEYDPELMEYVKRKTPVNEEEVTNYAWLDRLFADSITSPEDLAEREMLIEQLPEHLVPNEFIPTDVFVFGLGEPERPEATKIGGLPYMPSDLDWPMLGGEPMTFIAQINFADSEDIIKHQTPADVLLIFMPSDHASIDGELTDDDTTKLLWVKIKEQILLTSDDVPEQTSPPTPCFGVRHRMPEYQGEPMYWRTQVTRIGGNPAWIQGHEDSIPNDHKFIASLGGITSFRWGSTKFPLVNTHMDELTDEQRKNLWMYIDSGLLKIFEDEAGIPYARWECY